MLETGRKKSSNKETKLNMTSEIQFVVLIFLLRSSWRRRTHTKSAREIRERLRSFFASSPYLRKKNVLKSVLETERQRGICEWSRTATCECYDYRNSLFSHLLSLVLLQTYVYPDFYGTYWVAKMIYNTDHW